MSYNQRLDLDSVRRGGGIEVRAVVTGFLELGRNGDSMYATHMWTLVNRHHGPALREILKASQVYVVAVNEMLTTFRSRELAQRSELCITA